MNAECVLCTRVPEPLPGSATGWIMRDGVWAVSVHPAMAVPGWLAVQTVRHVESLDALDEQEAATLGRVLRSVAKSLREATDRKRTYLYSMGEKVRHVHLLLGVPLDGVDPNGTGGELLSRILRRDDTLVDAPQARQVAVAVRTALTQHVEP